MSPDATPANELLVAAVRARGVVAVAHALACSTTFVNQLVRGQRTPGFALAFRIADHLGIPLESWRPFVAPRVRRDRRSDGAPADASAGTSALLPQVQSDP
jgi:hypothetical protein